MSFVFTGVRHLKTGDEVLETKQFDKRDKYKQAYHHEMDSAISDDDCLGLGIRIFDTGTLQDVLVDNWVREIEEQI